MGGVAVCPIKNLAIVACSQVLGPLPWPQSRFGRNAWPRRALCVGLVMFPKTRSEPAVLGARPKYMGANMRAN
jgi:hypothetical protein